jgi:hypothetical protein
MMLPLLHAFWLCFCGRIMIVSMQAVWLHFTAAPSCPGMEVIVQDVVTLIVVIPS